MRGGGYILDGGGYVVRSLDYAMPGGGVAGAAAIRRFPLSQGELAFHYPSLADHLTLLAAYACDDAESPLVDDVGGRDLAEAAALVYRQAGDPLGRLGVSFDTSATTEFAAAADTAFFDLPSGADRSVIVRGIHPDNAGAARPIVGTSSINTGARWGLRLTTGGLMALFLSDGTNSPSQNTGVPADDGAVHDWFGVWHRTAGTPAGLVGQDGGALVSFPLGALSAVDAPTGLRVGSIHALAPTAGLIVTYIGFLAGAMTDADVAAWRTPT